MSYSNSLLETTNTKKIEGPPGVGFLLTEDGDYDMDNKKLTNLKEGTENNHALTKKQVNDLIAANGGSGDSVEITDYIKKDASTGGFTADLPMNDNKITDLSDGTLLQDAFTVHQLSNTAALKSR